ncbi:MAG: NYN domain-containing protein [Deltaproteobacteria bacterium]|nr:NYN domain-containing protein [Deltaproteobacteria bacterium]
MAVVIIDGYNLLGKANHLEREQLIAKLVAYKKTANHEFIVFFDGTHQGTRYGDEMIIENIKVVYTPLHETADDHMIAFMEENTHREVLVVSSDRKIQKAASANLLTYFESEAFLTRMQSKRQTSVFDEDVSNEIPKISTKKRGNPRRKSKKERKKRQQLKKL